MFVCGGGGERCFRVVGGEGAEVCVFEREEGEGVQMDECH